MSAKAKHMAKKRTSSLKVAGIVAGAIMALALVVYLAGAAAFTYLFFPNSTVGRVDVSLKTSSDAAEELQRALDARSVSVTGQGASFTVMSQQAGMASNTASAVLSVLSAQNVWAWPLEVGRRHDADDAVRSSCDPSVLNAYVLDAIAEHNASATEPVDASLFYDPASGLYRIDPGDPGTLLDADSITSKVIEAFGTDGHYAYLTTSDLVSQRVDANSESLVSSLASVNAYLGCNIDITALGNHVATLDSNTVVNWLSFADNGQAVFDSNAFKAWCNGIEELVDDAGTTRSYVRPDGKYVTVSGGAYGWISDGYALEAMLAQSILDHVQGPVEVPFKQTAVTYNPGGQEWGARYVDVDISEQYVRFYGSDGSIIWSSPCITGKPGHDTPTGCWFVTNKALNQTLIGLDENHDGEPDYRTPVTYWMPFQGNLVAFHDADWQPGFGGTMFQDGYGSHGCVNLPPGAAYDLYQIIQIGDVVITHY